MMSESPIVSLCIPTNGVTEWVFPVLDSIVGQNVSPELYEIIVTDNGDNQDFKQKMRAYQEQHKHIVYEETAALSFANQTEAYRFARGLFIKFINHRALMKEGALERLIAFVEDYRETKPVVYFSNGVIPMAEEISEYTTFDQFVRHLSYWSSWSSGLAIWKEDFDKIPEDTVYDKMFPHTTILFRERERGHYIIDNTVMTEELPNGSIPKARYDLFRTFGVDYPAILFDLLRDQSISYETFKYVKDQNLWFLVELYWAYVIRKRPCSYDLSGLSRVFDVFYTKADFNKTKRLFVLKKAAGLFGKRR